MEESIISIRKLNKVYPNGCHALRNINLEVKKGEFLVVIGLSGSGKSTLLRCINRLHDITSGEATFKGMNITHQTGKELRNTRARIGMVFQHFNLIPRKTVMQNVLTGSLANTGIIKSLVGNYTDVEKQQAMKYIKIVGLEGKEYVRADNLSGGQQQRVAIARALMQNPDVLLADEPVASLDPATSNSVMQYLEKINKEMGVTVICNLHFLSLVRQYATRVVALKGGAVVYEGAPLDICQEWFKRIYGEDAVEVTAH